jgi:hypothetical protein
LIADEPEAQTHSLRVARVRSSQDVEANVLASPQRPQRMSSVEVEYDERNRVSFSGGSSSFLEAAGADTLTSARYSYERRGRGRSSEVSSHTMAIAGQVR